MPFPSLDVQSVTHLFFIFTESDNLKVNLESDLISDVVSVSKKVWNPDSIRLNVLFGNICSTQIEIFTILKNKIRFHKLLKLTMNILMLIIIKSGLCQYDDQCQARQQCSQCSKCQQSQQSNTEIRLKRDRFKTWDEMALAKIEHVMKQKEALQEFTDLSINIY